MVLWWPAYCAADPPCPKYATRKLGTCPNWEAAKEKMRWHLLNSSNHKDVTEDEAHDLVESYQEPEPWEEEEVDPNDSAGTRPKQPPPSREQMAKWERSRGSAQGQAGWQVADHRQDRRSRSPAGRRRGDRSSSSHGHDEGILQLQLPMTTSSYIAPNQV